MAEESYLALHRQGRLRAEIDTNAFRENPLSPERDRVVNR